MESFQPHDNIDSDYLLACKLNSEINGPDANAAFLIHNQMNQMPHSQAGSSSTTAGLQQNLNPVAQPLLANVRSVPTQQGTRPVNPTTAFVSAPSSIPQCVDKQYSSGNLQRAQNSVLAKANFSVQGNNAVHHNQLPVAQICGSSRPAPYPFSSSTFLIQNQSVQMPYSQARSSSTTAGLQQTLNPLAQPLLANARFVSTQQGIRNSGNVRGAQNQVLDTANYSVQGNIAVHHNQLPAAPQIGPASRPDWGSSRPSRYPVTISTRAARPQAPTSCLLRPSSFQAHRPQAPSTFSATQMQAANSTMSAQASSSGVTFNPHKKILIPVPKQQVRMNVRPTASVSTAAQPIRNVPTQTQATSLISSAQPQAAGSSAQNQTAAVPVSKPTSVTDDQQPSTAIPTKRYPWMIQRSVKTWLVPQKSSGASHENVASTSARAETELVGIANSSKIIKKEKSSGNHLLLVAKQYLHNQDLPSTSTANIPQQQKNSSQKIAVENKRTSPEDYHMPALNAFIKDSLDDWKIIDIEPNIISIWSALRNYYFRCAQRLSLYIPEWNGPEFTDLTNFRIDTEHRRVMLNPTTLLKRSRLNLINVLFHALIHCSVYESGRARNKRIDDHDANFNQIKNHFNDILDLEIGTNHSFLRADADDLESYQCQGKCSENIFRGIIKCRPGSPVPPPIIVDSTHSTCNGKFHKVFEISRGLNNNIETRYVVHKTHENPTSAEQCAENRQKVNTKPREIIDITDDDDANVAAGPKVVTTTQLIDLEDDEFSDKKSQNTRKIVEQFKSQPRNVFDYCPFCKKLVEEFGGLGPHLDFCLAF